MANLSKDNMLRRELRSTKVARVNQNLMGAFEKPDSYCRSGAAVWDSEY